MPRLRRRGLALKISSNNTSRGASGHAAAIASRNAASPQQIRPGPASRNIVASSPAACRAYIGTAISPPRESPDRARPTGCCSERRARSDLLLRGRKRARKPARPRFARAIPHRSRFDRRPRSLRPKPRGSRPPANAKKCFRENSLRQVAHASDCGSTLLRQSKRSDRSLVSVSRRVQPCR